MWVAAASPYFCAIIGQAFVKIKYDIVKLGIKGNIFREEKEKDFRKIVKPELY